MKISLIVASLVCSVCSLDAQITATLIPAPKGLDQVKIRNNFALNVVAYVVVAQPAPQNRRNPPAAMLVTYYAPLVDRPAKPLEPNEERVVMGFVPPAASKSAAAAEILSRIYAGPDHIYSEPILAAGILADGSTSGDRVLIERLLLRRSNMLLAVETTLEALVDAGQRNVAREQLIRQFRKLAESLDRGYLPAEQRVGKAFYQSMIDKLIALPQGPLGSPFPPDSFVAEETAVLSRQRAELLESQPSLVGQFGH